MSLWLCLCSSIFFMLEGDRVLGVSVSRAQLATSLWATFLWRLRTLLHSTDNPFLEETSKHLILVIPLCAIATQVGRPLRIAMLITLTSIISSEICLTSGSFKTHNHTYSPPPPPQVWVDVTVCSNFYEPWSSRAPCIWRCQSFPHQWPLCASLWIFLLHIIWGPPVWDWWQNLLQQLLHGVREYSSEFFVSVGIIVTTNIDFVVVVIVTSFWKMWKLQRSLLACSNG